jgi:hypothetical protein
MVNELTATETLTWKTRKVDYQAGLEVTEHYTTDGRFTIIKTGHTSNRKANGARGQVLRKFRFTGFLMTDHLSTRPTYLRKHVSGHTVSDLKRQAERRALKGGI